jgi:hypothetical protein
MKKGGNCHFHLKRTNSLNKVLVKFQKQNYEKNSNRARGDSLWPIT